MCQLKAMAEFKKIAEVPRRTRRQLLEFNPPWGALAQYQARVADSSSNCIWGDPCNSMQKCWLSDCVLTEVPGKRKDKCVRLEALCRRCDPDGTRPERFIALTARTDPLALTRRSASEESLYDVGRGFRPTAAGTDALLVKLVVDRQCESRPEGSALDRCPRKKLTLRPAGTVRSQEEHDSSGLRSRPCFDTLPAHNTIVELQCTAFTDLGA